jgi:vancomycin resistance protein VanW
VKRLIPSSLRLQLKLILRFYRDVRSGQFLKIVRSSQIRTQSQGQHFDPRVEVVQALKVANYSENKRQNLTIAANCIQNIVIQPGEIFSFWALVGAPIAKRGYLEGRALVNGQLKAVIGGGLCQLSGILYYLALQAGLTAIERYPHSADIYNDETRFTPLGSDATVVYGYKDLRLVNSLSQPLCFRIIINPDQITGELCTPNPIPTYHVEFRIQEPSDRTELTRVETLRSAIGPQGESEGESEGESDTILLEAIEVSLYRHKKSV